MATISVSVYSGGRRLFDKDRPVRRLPDGRYGVVYQGAVYPLSPGPSINIDGRAYSPDRCPVLRDLPQELRTPGPGSKQKLYLDASGFYKYILVEGGEAALDASLKACSDAGIGVLAWGESTRPADDGHQYDWYIRVDEASASRLTSLLHSNSQPSQASTVSAAPKPPPRPERALPLQDETPKPEKAPAVPSSAASQQIASLRLEVARLTAELAAVREKASSPARSAVQPIAPAETGQLVELRHKVSELESQNAQLRDTNVQANELGNRYAKEAEELNNALKARIGEVEDLEATTDQLRAQLAALQSAQTRASRSSATLRERLRLILEHLLPGTILERDTFDQLFDDLRTEDLKAPLQAIRALALKENVPCKRFHPTDWFEVAHGKFAPTMRLYFHRAADRLRVYLSPKSRQALDEHWLKSN